MKIELLVIMIIFTIGYFVVANKISYAFDVDYDNDLYELTIESIEKQAVFYANAHEELFVEENEIYITISDLAAGGFIISNNGVVVDPRNEEKNLNERKVKLVKKDDEITAKVLN